MIITPPSENDGITRTPANENPWYILMTLHGEYEEYLSAQELNNLKEDNRLSWNHFFNGTPQQKEHSIELFKKRSSNIFLPNVLSHCNFDKTIFSKNIYLSYFRNDKASFKNCIFNGKCIIDSLPNANFSGTVFHKEFHLKYTDFKRNLIFRNCVFNDNATFEASENSSLDLSDTTFHKNLVIKKSYDHLICNKTTFKDSVNLIDLTIIKSARFYRTKFYKTAKFPKDLHENVSFQGADFSHIIANYKDENDANEGLLYFQILKKYMENNKRYHDEMLFFKYELQTLEHINRHYVKGGWLKNIPSKCYGLFSDYGASILRPIMGLFVTYYYGFVIYLTNIVQNSPNKKLLTNNEQLEAFSSAALLSITNIFSPLGLHKIFENRLKELNCFNSPSLLVLIQIFFGIIFMFLLGLGLRNKFKIK